MKRANGFTLVEMVAVLVIVATLAAISIPSIMTKIIKEQITVGITLADIAKQPISAAWSAQKILYKDNKSAGLPAPNLIVNNVVSSLEVVDGVINITFGNKVSTQMRGKTLSLRPAVIEEAQIVPITWVCGYANGPDKMTVKGTNSTDIPKDWLPQGCK